MHRSEQHAFQRGEDAYGGLAGDVVLLGDQVISAALVRVSLTGRTDAASGLAIFDLLTFALAMRTLSRLCRFQNAGIASLLQSGGVNHVAATSQGADLESNIGGAIQPPVAEQPN